MASCEGGGVNGLGVGRFHGARCGVGFLGLVGGERMILSTVHREIVLTHRALRQYRKGMDRSAVAGDVLGVMGAAELVWRAPGWLLEPDPADAYLVSKGGLWVLRRRGDEYGNQEELDWVAVSFVPRRDRLLKAEVRARRAQAEEDREWAA